MRKQSIMHKACAAASILAAVCFAEIPFELVIVEPDEPGHSMAADIDGDGFNDVFVGKFGPYNGGTRSIVWYRYPDWDKHVISAFNYQTDDVACGDVDDDGDIDAFGFKDDDGKLMWFENPLLPGGDPATGTWTEHGIGTGGVGFVKDADAVDMNGDGKLDLVVRGHGTTAIWVQNSPTSWTKETSIDHHHKEGMEVEDMDGDDDIDIVLNGFWLENGNNWQAHEIDAMWYTQSTGNWWDNNCYVAIGDFDGDGDPDPAFGQSGTTGFPVNWYSADAPTGTWTKHEVASVVDYCQSLGAGDMDNDGDVDIMAAVSGGYGNNQEVSVFLNSGDGTQWTQQVVATTGGYSLTLGDIDNDNDLDILGERGHHLGPIQVWRNLSDPVATRPHARRDADTRLSTASILTRQGRILVELLHNAKAQTIEIFALSGARVRSAHIRAGTVRAIAVSPGCYQVRIGSRPLTRVVVPE
ncbi:MAG: hypothetical protein GF418_16715 [Chitinivibrionales bacterium]|nr:hypothetical protein [Chitinivibrionales bacterium]MBD3397265.1 hypothetical protein [Chitinivibrionales bacterium]